MNGTNYEVPQCEAFSNPHSHPSWAQIFPSGSCFEIPLPWGPPLKYHPVKTNTNTKNKKGPTFLIDIKMKQFLQLNPSIGKHLGRGMLGHLGRGMLGGMKYSWDSVPGVATVALKA